MLRDDVNYGKSSYVKAIIIDEISVVSNKLLRYVHQRLIEIFGCVSDFSKPFAGVTINLGGGGIKLTILERTYFLNGPFVQFTAQQELDSNSNYRYITFKQNERQ